MTNEEAYNIISEYCFTGFEDNKKPSAKLFNAIRELVCEVHTNAELRDYKGRLEKENTKLKAENERLKYVSKVNVRVMNLNYKQYQEIEQLQSTNAKLCEENAELRKEVIKKQLF